MKKLGQYIKTHRWPVGAAGAVVTAVILMTAIPMSAAMLEDNTLHACFVKGSGIMYLIGQPGGPAACRGQKHTEVTWNIVGPQGPPGPTGPAGPGVTNIETVSQDFAATNVGNGGIAQGSVDCPSGKVLVSGGAQIKANDGTVPALIALVTSAPGTNGWSGVAREQAIPVPPAQAPGGGGWKLTVFARCGTQTS
ncbi:MAG TPA: hypothetical protein VFT29_06190 [Gemmatimonadaceae bacterium]|nr:hypothetical protein [Gemmatimonadaceae bacterium]